MGLTKKKILKVRLGRQDSIIHNWYDLCRKQNISCSDVAMMAIEYYARTGNFLIIGYVMDNTHVESKDIKTFSISDTEFTYQWLINYSDEREKGITTILKKILKNSLVRVDNKSDEHILTDDELYFAVDKAVAKVKKYSTQAGIVTNSFNVHGENFANDTASNNRTKNDDMVDSDNKTNVDLKHINNDDVLQDLPEKNTDETLGSESSDGVINLLECAKKADGLLSNLLNGSIM